MTSYAKINDQWFECFSEELGGISEYEGFNVYDYNYITNNVHLIENPFKDVSYMDIPDTRISYNNYTIPFIGKNKPYDLYTNEISFGLSVNDLKYEKFLKKHNIITIFNKFTIKKQTERSFNIDSSGIRIVFKSYEDAALFKLINPDLSKFSCL